jgi:hypothetical protein
MSKGLTSPPRAFLFGFVCRDFGPFYLSCVRRWFCYLCFVVPIAPIPSCFDGRFVILLGSYSVTLVVPDMMSLTVKSSERAQVPIHPASSTPPSFSACSTYIHPTHLRHCGYFSFHVNLSSPLHFPSNSTPLACAIDQASHRSIRFSSNIILLHVQNALLSFSFMSPFYTCFSYGLVYSLFFPFR